MHLICSFGCEWSVLASLRLIPLYHNIKFFYHAVRFSLLVCCWEFMQLYLSMGTDYNFFVFLVWLWYWIMLSSIWKNFSQLFGIIWQELVFFYRLGSYLAVTPSSHRVSCSMGQLCTSHSNSFLITDLFLSLISSWFSFCSLFVSRNLCISYRFSSFWCVFHYYNP